MSPRRESKSSGRIARPKRKTRRSATSRKASKSQQTFTPDAFLASICEGGKALLFAKKRAIFQQGAAADAVFYLQTGKVKLSVVSKTGKEATIGILSERSFFGEGLAGGPNSPHVLRDRVDGLRSGAN